MIIKKDSKIVKAKVERKSLALKAKKESSDEECSTSRSEDEDRDDENGKSDRKCFRCGDSNYLIGECPKPPKDKNQRAFVEGSWSDSGEEDDEKEIRSCKYRLIQSLASKELVRNLPKLKFDQHFCDACKIRKQAHVSHKAKNIVSTTRCLELLHMDLFGPSAVRSYGGNRYTLVIVDDSSRKFDNEVQFGEFCNANGITHNFSAPRTPQSNGMVKRKNKTLQEMSRTMLNEQSLPQKFWCNTVDTSTYILNQILIRAILGKTPYELLREPKNVNEALGDESWVVAMQEELNQFIANNVWELVPQPRNMKIIGTKWVFRNKLDENDIVSQNKPRLVAQGYNQQEGINYDETYAQVARLESIRILLAYACALDFKLFQMDVKSAFLNGFINEEVYVAQPSGFIDFEKPNQVYKLINALYGLTQAPKAWPDIMCSVYLCARFQEAPKTSHLEAVKRIFQYIKGTTHLGLWYHKGTDIETVVYADSDHAGDYVDRKSTSGICTFVGCCLTSWFSKKQTALAISTTEAEYVSARKACQQALWMKQALIDHDVRLDNVPIMCDNKGAIDLSKNPVQHSRTKHIEIRHHFLRDNV
nr:copia protein [Tanacetum cinerariifolium]